MYVILDLSRSDVCSYWITEIKSLAIESQRRKKMKSF